MLEIVSKGFKTAKNLITGQTELTESNIDAALKEIRLSLLEADVDLAVVKAFLGRVKERAIGEIVPKELKSENRRLKVSPGDHFTAICQDELEKLMGEGQTIGQPITFRRPLTTIMMVGLQGAGKTTTCGKLANYLKAQKRKVMLVAGDVYRPAAYEQLKVLGDSLNIPVFHKEGLMPPDLVRAALYAARERRVDVLILDTAGRLAIDEPLMKELEDVKAIMKPDNIFLVVDAMSGRDAVNTAAEFNRRLDLTGFIMTKLDGDARGGSALSIKEVTGKPIRFLGMGEGLDKLEEFRPAGLASRILGMGDIVGLMKDFENVVDEREAKKDTKKLLSGQFTLEDFLKQMRSLQKLGSLTDIMERFPLFGSAGLPEGMQLDDKVFTRFEAMIASMTPQEKANPQIIDDSRARRIAKGSGHKSDEVKELVGHFSMMQNMMRHIGAQPGLLGALPGFKQLAQMRKLRGMDMKDLLGDMPPEALAQMGQMGGGMGPGMMPPGMAPGMVPPGMNPAMLPPGMARMMPGMMRGAPAPVTSKDKAKAKAKKKQQKKARKAARR